MSEEFDLKSFLNVDKFLGRKPRTKKVKKTTLAQVKTKDED